MCACLSNGQLRLTEPILRDVAPASAVHNQINVGPAGGWKGERSPVRVASSMPQFID